MARALTLSSQSAPIFTAYKAIQSNVFIQVRGLKNKELFKSLLPTGSIPECPIEWKKPERIPFNHHWRTGDGKPIHDPIDMTQPPDVVNKSEEFLTACDSVKRMFSLDFLGRKYAMLKIRDDLINTVKNHEYDTDSIEVQIAAKTAIIKNLNEHVNARVERDRIVNAYLSNIIFKRKKQLIHLRKWDYKKFEWLLEKLDLYYTPYPEEFYHMTRKNSIRAITDKYVEDYKERKLEEYREKLDSQKEEFLKHKLSSHEWMRKEELQCGVEPTITEEMIEQCRVQLLEHQEVLRKRVFVKDKSANILIEA